MTGIETSIEASPAATLAGARAGSFAGAGRLGRLERFVGPATAMLVALLGFLPIYAWVPGGPGRSLYRSGSYMAGLTEWMSGTVIAVGLGLVLALLARRVPWLWRDRLLAPVADAYAARPVAVMAACTALALALYVAIARYIFDGAPLIIDEVVQVLNARIMAHGALSIPTPAHPEFTSLMHWVDVGDRSYAQFPAGWPAMLAPFWALGVTWLAAPLCGAAAVAAFASFARRAEPRAGVALAATVLFAVSPFMALMAGTHMNHTPALMWCLAGAAALARVVERSDARPRAAFLCGLAFGCAAAIRPMDAFAFAVPAGVWLLARTVRTPGRWRELAAAGVGIALPVLAVLWVNERTTGSALRFGYQVLWGDSVSPGFHDTPWGVHHTPARGLGIINLYFMDLQGSLFDTAFPSLLPLIAALALTRRLGALDRYLLIASSLIIGIYFAYWHDGYYLGPRFFISLMPVLALWTARSLPALRERLGEGLAYRTTVYAVIVGAAIGLTVSMPLRMRQNRMNFFTMRADVNGGMARAGVRDALVFVRESWGSQVVARLWALGVSRAETEHLYSSVDLCILDEAVHSLERDGVRGEAAAAALRPLDRYASQLVKSPYSPDESQHALPGLRYSERCIARVRDDRAGFTSIAPLLLARDGDNVIARDLHERNAYLLAEYPDRPVYLARPAGVKVDSPLEFVRISRDSLLREAEVAAGERGPRGR